MSIRCEWIAGRTIAAHDQLAVNNKKVPANMRRMLCFMRIASISLFIAQSFTPAWATLLITIGNSVVLPGGGGEVDVTITSDNPLGDQLAQFGFEFRISTLGATQLDFVNPQADGQLSSLSYVFAGNSLDAAFPPVGTVSGVIVPNDTFIGGDATFDGAEVSVGAVSQLLVRLDLTTATVLPPVGGDLFEIELVPGPNTFFQNRDFESIPFQSTPGEIQITAVPEPAGYIPASIGFLFGMMIIAWNRSRIWPRFREA